MPDNDTTSSGEPIPVTGGSVFLPTGAPKVLQVRRPCIDHTFVDGAGVPCAFRKVQVRYLGGTEVTVDAFTDETGRLYVKDVPAGEYEIQLLPATPAPIAQEAASEAAAWRTLAQNLDTQQLPLPLWDE